ncbi:phosphatase PAP2 family protein [Acidomonas methanolica]|uniref:phosphatase PAP2 family protein n=1 Tax=Acidomonas methanolica TaxID=437 RepID=UPI00211A101A|nr:phosphatase PAP2 family protein [Acidomonas methanolica]MCQ9156490.1 phosphatase PAP2 family protein [Acidomonas methanolica]
MADLIGYISDFGDEYLLWPLIGIGAAILVWQKRFRLAAAWLGLAVASFGTVLMLKLLLEACGRHPDHPLYSPSGHTAGATFVFGGMAVLFFPSALAALPAAIAVAALIGATRLFLGAHDLPEVLVGGAIGLGGVAALLLVRLRLEGAAGRPAASAMQICALFAGCVATTVLLHGVRSPAERWIEQVSHQFLRPLACSPATPDESGGAS